MNTKVKVLNEYLKEQGEVVLSVHNYYLCVRVTKKGCYIYRVYNNFLEFMFEDVSHGSKFSIKSLLAMVLRMQILGMKESEVWNEDINALIESEVDVVTRSDLKAAGIKILDELKATAKDELCELEQRYFPLVRQSCKKMFALQIALIFSFIYACITSIVLSNGDLWFVILLIAAAIILVVIAMYMTINMNELRKTYISFFDEIEERKRKLDRVVDPTAKYLCYADKIVNDLFHEAYNDILVDLVPAPQKS